MNSNTEERLTTIEIKVAYLEDFINKLQSISIEQNNEIDRLLTENRIIKNKINEILEGTEGDIPNRRPPHY